MILKRLLIFIAATGAACSPFAARAAATGLRLGPDGEILVWLVSGPFPNVGALEMRGTGFATDYLQGEASATATEGAVIPMIPFESSTDPRLTNKRKPGWQLGIGTATNGLDLAELLNGSKPAIAYLYTEIISPDARDAQMLFGSDDGARVFLNGEMLFQKQVARGIKRDEERFAIHLKAGANRLLFKVEQGNGGWGLLARVADAHGNAEPDLRERVDIGRQAPQKMVPGERWIRAEAGGAGDVDVSSAVSYDLIEARSRRWLSRFKNEADHPELLSKALDDTTTRLQEDKDSDRLSADLTAGQRLLSDLYSKSRERLVRETQQARPLFTTRVSAEDYVTVLKGGRYFAHSDGSPLVPIGYNHNPDWPEFEESNPDRDVYKPDETRAYMGHLKSDGVNVIRLMLETPPTGNLEEPIGTFSLEHVRWLDTIVSAARENNIKLIVTPWDTFWMNLRFDTTPYNPALGGSLKNRIEFITSPVLREQEKRRLRYIIDRWGNSGTIFSWELLNEGDLWWGETPQQLRDWIEDMTQYVRKYERSKWGRNHLLSVSIAESMPKGALATDAYSLPELDYATTHLYIGASRAPTEPVGPAKAIQQGVQYALSRIGDARPYMDTENGPIDRWVDSAELDDQVFHNMSWAHLCSGGAGSSFRWPYRNPHHLTEGMLSSLKIMSEFVDKAPWKELAGDRVETNAEGSEGAATCSFGTRSAALAWSTGEGNLKIRWANAPTTVVCHVFDTRSGQWLGERKVKSENGVITTPLLPKNGAVIITRGS